MRYGFTGSDDGAALVLDGGSVLNQRFVGLPGGVSVSFGAGQQWSYPNLHGDITVTADQVGCVVPGCPGMTRSGSRSIR